MKYIYDIVLNFNKDYYDFYEWNNDDRIINIKKIPLYRVSKNDYLSIKYNDIIINNFSDRIFLITDTLGVMGVMLNKSGRVIKRSSLLIDEEDEILDESKKLKIFKLNIKRNIYKKREIIGRNTLEKRRVVNSFFRKVNKKDDIYLLKYIYYDLYQRDDDINNIYDLLVDTDINLLYDELKKVGFLSFNKRM